MSTTTPRIKMTMLMLAALEATAQRRAESSTPEAPDPIESPPIKVRPKPPGGNQPTVCCPLCGRTGSDGEKCDHRWTEHAGRVHKRMRLADRSET